MTSADREGLQMFLVERYWPGVTRAAVDGVARRAQRAAQQLRREGTPVRHLLTLLVPGDEALLCLFEAPSFEAVEAANRRAEIPFDRITPTEPAGAGPRVKPREDVR
jgi:hypothetical protein